MEGGAFGLFIVDEPDDGVFAGWATEEVHERLLQIQRVGGSTVLGNGDNPDVTLVPLSQGLWYRLHTSIVDSQARTDTLGFSTTAGDCKVVHVASDGVPLATPKPLFQFEVHGGARSDFAICCDSANVNMDVTFAKKTVATLQVTPSSGATCGNAPEPYNYQRPPMMQIPMNSPLPSSQYRDISMSAAQINGQCK